MKKNTLNIDVPASLHKKLRKLAEIAHCSPESIVLTRIENDVEQFYDDKDLDCLIPFVGYESIEIAESAAKAASAFQGRPGSYLVDPNPENDGKFYVHSEWEAEGAERRAVEEKLIPVDFGYDPKEGRAA